MGCWGWEVGEVGSGEGGDLERWELRELGGRVGRGGCGEMGTGRCWGGCGRWKLGVWGFRGAGKLRRLGVGQVRRLGAGEDGDRGR